LLIAVSQDMSIAPAPAGVDASTLGAAPVAGIAAMTAIDALKLSAGDTLLVVGATGGVGSFAVQLAARAGVTVVAPALPEDEPYLRELGVTELLPRDDDLDAAARERYPDGFDAILDLVSFTGDSAGLLKDGGRLASPLGAAGDGPGRTNVMAAPTRENLERLGRLLADGTLRVPVQATYELAQAPEALTALAATHTLGKLAIRIE
jgi:NADPH2:quinone reductase